VSLLFSRMRRETREGEFHCTLPTHPLTHLPPRYFLGVRDPEKEVIFEGPPPRMFAFEGSRMPNRADEENRLRQLLLCEIDSYSAAEGTERAGAAGRSGSICSSDYSAPAGVGASTKDSAK
jgi:hypothetical protein